MGGEHRIYGRLQAIMHLVATSLIVLVAMVLLYRLLVDVGRGATAAPARAGTAAGRPAPPLPQEPVSLEGAALRGSTTARVALIEYLDVQCPYCAAFVRETLPALEEQYIRPGKILFAIRHFPLRSIHPFAAKSAEAAECAGDHGKFWEMHDAMFANPKLLDEPNLRAQAARLGLDGAAFSTCLAGARSKDVEADEVSGRRLGVTGTPTFFLGVVNADRRVKVVERFSGARSIEQFRRSIDRVLTDALALQTR